MNELGYRPDVDGLRAVAVLAVIAFHADIRFFSGGYVGVDVFFVISGFLIGSMLLKEFDAGTYSTAQFYKRRILRIAPALFALLLTMLLVLPFLLFPQQVLQFVESLRASVLSLSNLYFAAHSNYFSDRYGKPLLHTWSLAVEEQFYVFLPLLLLLLKRTNAKMRAVILFAIFTLSIIASEVLVHRNLNMAYYSPVSRCWELLLGTLLTYLMPFQNKIPRWLRELLLVTGLVLILGSVHYYSSKTLFPGLAAVAPCMGAALLILCGRRSRDCLANGFLYWRPVVFIGLISYSLYLWHWPVVVFIKMGLIPHLPYHHRSQTILILTSSFVLAVLSWKFVEQPFRGRQMRNIVPARVLASFAAVCVGFIVLSSLAIHLPSPFPTDALAMSRFVDQVDNEGYRKGTCYVGDPYSFSAFNRKLCLAQDPHRRNVLVLGDSHAAAEYPGLRHAFPEINFLQATNQGCMPLKDVQYSSDCSDLMKLIFDQFLPSHHLDAVLLVGRWLDESDLHDLDRTIAYLREIGQNPILVGPSPEYRMSLPWLVAYSLTRHDPLLPLRYEVDDLFTLDSSLRADAETLGISYISPLNLLCPNRQCIYLANVSPRIPLLFDSNHFTVEGSELFAERLRQKQNQIFCGQNVSRPKNKTIS